MKAAWEAFHKLHTEGKVKAAWAVENGLGEAVMKMSFGNSIGFVGNGYVRDQWHMPGFYGFLVAELTEEVDLPCAEIIGHTSLLPVVDLDGDSALISELLKINESVLENVYPTKVPEKSEKLPAAIAESTRKVRPSIRRPIA